VGHQPDDLDVPQHPANFVVQTQLLLGAETLHAIERRVDMIGQALRLLPAGIVAALRTAFPVKAGRGRGEGGVGVLSKLTLIWAGRGSGMA